MSPCTPAAMLRALACTDRLSFAAKPVPEDGTEAITGTDPVGRAGMVLVLLLAGCWLLRLIRSVGRAPRPSRLGHPLGTGYPAGR